jgi:hypothetical protein
MFYTSVKLWVKKTVRIFYSFCKSQNSVTAYMRLQARSLLSQAAEKLKIIFSLGNTVSPQNSGIFFAMSEYRQRHGDRL